MAEHVDRADLQIAFQCPRGVTQDAIHGRAGDPPKRAKGHRR